MLPTKKENICRNYLWGKCVMGNNCRFQHVFDIEIIKNTVKFCHDYQNGVPCKKVPCKFIHTTESEQALFFKTGEVPKVLAERYANMISAETIPQMAMHNQESLSRPPPPLQTVPQPSTTSTIEPQQTYNMGQIPVMSMGSMPHPGIGMGSMHPVAMNMRPKLPTIMSMPGPSSMVAPPPTPIHHLPPPPPPPTQSSTSSTQSTAPIYTAPPPPAMRLSPKQPPSPVPLKFDPSKPPPPLPNATSKRPSVNNGLEAGPSKMRKEAEPNNDDARCDLCQQRQIRIDVYDKDIEKMYTRYKLQNLIYKKKLEEVQRKEDILKTMLNPEVYKLIYECLEEGSKLQDSVNQNAIPSDRSLFAQMIKHIVDNDSAHSTSPRLEESLRTLMSRPNPNNTIQNPSLSLREFMRDGNKKREVQPTGNGTSNRSNDYSNHNTTYNERTQASYSQSSSIASTSKTQSSPSGAKTVATTASYFYYNMPPPISRSYNMMPQTTMTPAAGTSMMTHQQNGMPGPSQTVAKPSTSAPPPKPNNQSMQNSVPFPPQTPYYYPYQ